MKVTAACFLLLSVEEKNKDKHNCYVILVASQSPKTCLAGTFSVVRISSKVVNVLFT
jgi:hypothetical protein